MVSQNQRAKTAMTELKDSMDTKSLKKLMKNFLEELEYEDTVASNTSLGNLTSKTPFSLVRMRDVIQHDMEASTLEVDCKL